MRKSNKILRTTTVPGSLNNFCRGLLLELTVEGYEVVAVSSPGPAMGEIAVREVFQNDLINYGIMKKPLKVVGYRDICEIDLNQYHYPYSFRTL